MPSMWRHGFTWTGFSGGPGRTVMYANTAVATGQAFANELYTFMTNTFTSSGGLNNLPAGVRVAQDPFLDEIESSNGDQVGRLACNIGADLVGVGGGNWAAPAGASVTWSTNNFVKGRRVRGRTYLVPLDGQNCFQTDGTLSSTFLTNVANNILAFINGTSEPVVWHRPTTKDGVDGLMCPIVTGQMRDMVSILTSRRD